MSLEIALGTARSGLAAVQRSLAQASQNVGNAGSASYTRKTVPLEALSVDGLPNGVRAGAAQRSVDAALLARLEQSRSGAAGAELRERLLQSVEQVQGTPGDGNGLTDALGALHQGFIALRASPADAGQQRAARDAADTVARRLNGTSDAIGQARQAAQDTMQQEVASINATLRQIASLTARLKLAPQGPDAADLEDRRDAAVSALSESLEVRAVRQPGGDITLLARGGTVLPLDPDRDLLSLNGANVAPQAFHGGGGTLPGVMMQGIDITDRLAGGRLGEAIGLRDRVLPRLQGETDVTASQLAMRLSAEGLTLFTDADGSVPATTGAYAGGQQVGFAGRIRVNAAIVTNPALLRDGTQAVAGAPGGPTAFTPNPAGGPAGFTTLLDRVLDFGFGEQAAAGVAWAPIPVSGLGPDGSLTSSFLAAPTIEGHATRSIAALAADRAAATAAKQEAGDLKGALEQRFRQQSGVDVDAELAGMITLQNAYAANARVLSTVQTMWDQLLASVR